MKRAYERFVFLTNCVEWRSGEDIQQMIDRAIQITRRTFLQHVQMDDIAQQLGYSRHHKQGLTMSKDYHVSYHQGRFVGAPAYYFRWSAIEHIFVPEDQVERIRKGDGNGLDGRVQDGHVQGRLWPAGAGARSGGWPM